METPQSFSRRILAQHGYSRAIKPIAPPIPWIENNFYLYDTGQLMTLYECQRRPLELALERINGQFRFNTVLWSWPKKSAKSSVIAAVADYVAESRMNASVKLIGNDLKQADSRVGYYVRESIKLGQQAGMRDKSINIVPSGYKITYPTGSKIECVPVDPSGEAGGNDDMIVYSELWGWKSKAHQRMWSEMTLSPNKFGNSQRWIDTYAGFQGESPILEQLYDTGVKNGVKVWDDLEVYINEQARMLTVWVTQWLLPWQISEQGRAYYSQEEAQLTPNEFRRMHKNEWVSAIDAFVPIEWWDACKVDSLTPLRDRQGVIVALDAAVYDDCFALVMVSREGDKIQTREVHIWTPPANGQISFLDVERELERITKTYNVTCITYDPYQLADMAQRLSRLGYWEEFNQGKERAVADKQLYDLIRDRRIQHQGEPMLKEHIANANRKPEDEKLRIVKRSQSLKIDAAVALSMAADKALYYNI